MLLWPFNKYPGTDYETYNWEWLIGLGKKMEKALHDLFSDTGALHQMVDKVLGEHPEWVTTVMDGAIGETKIASAFLPFIRNLFRTPEEYGAVGDGVADDTAAVQAAFDAGTLVWLRNTYKISSTINITANNTQIYANGSIIMDPTVTIGSLISSDGYSNILISGLKLKGYALSTTNDNRGLVGITMINGSEYTIRQCEFDGLNLNIRCSGQNVKVKDNTILNGIETATQINGYGILFEGVDDGIIENNSINVDRHTVYLNSCHRIKVLANTLKSIENLTQYHSGQETNIKLTAGDQLDIIGNTMTGGVWGVDFSSGFDLEAGHGFDNVTIANNYISKLATSSGLTSAMIGISRSITTPIKNLVIHDNVFSNSLNTARGVVIEGLTNLVVIASNVFQEFYNQIIRNNKVSEHLIITDNKFINESENANIRHMYVDAASNVTFKNNIATQQVAYYMSAAAALDTDIHVETFRGDLNTLHKAGTYYCGSGVTNNPSNATFGWLEVINPTTNLNTGACMQRMIDSTGNYYYIRTFANNAWNNWRQISIS